MGKTLNVWGNVGLDRVDARKKTVAAATAARSLLLTTIYPLFDALTFVFLLLGDVSVVR